MKIRKYSVWILITLAAILPIALIFIYAIGLEVYIGKRFTGENFFTSPVFAFIIGFSHTTVFILLIYFLKKKNLKLADIGWKKYQPSKALTEVGIGIALSILLYVFKEIALDSLSAILTGRQPTFYSLFNFQLKEQDAYLLLVAFIFPFVEESIFRGYPYQQLRHKWHDWQIILVSSLIFGAMHTLGDGRGFTSGINTAIIGAIYFLIFKCRKNLYAPTATHSFYNFMIVLT